MRAGGGEGDDRPLDLIAHWQAVDGRRWLSGLG
jgi:hypothetical protein